MMFNETEIRCIRILAKWFEDSRDMVNKPEAIKAFEISEPEYTPLMRKLKACNAFDKVLSGPSPTEFALDFIPGAHCVQLVHEIEAQQLLSQAPPDIVEQLYQRTRRNPKTAWTIIIFLILSLVFSTLNNLFEFVHKLITFFSK